MLKNQKLQIQHSYLDPGKERIHKKKNGKSWSFGPTRVGGGLTESQLFGKISQN